MVRLGKGSLCKHVSSALFVYETVALLIHIDIGRLHNLMVSCTGCRISGRKKLDIAHVLESCPCLHGHINTVAGNRRHIGRLDLIVQLFIPNFIVLIAHLHICAKTASCQNHTFRGIKCVVFPVRSRSLNSDHCSVFGN